MKYYLEHLREVAKDNEDAYQYLVTMSKVFRTWDDLWDKDREITKETADEVFVSLNFELSRNKFFEDNRKVLESFVFIAWNAWRDSNEWKGSQDKNKGLCAWFIRDWCNEIDHLVAWLVGGVEHARKISLKTREFYLNQLLSRGKDGFV